MRQRTAAVFLLLFILGLVPGMVLTVEPGLYYPEKGIDVRIEDTILITAAVPKEIAEIEALLQSKSKSSRVQE